MNLKKILLSSFAAGGLAFTSQAEVDLGAIKTLLVPDDAIGLVEDSTKGEFTLSVAVERPQSRLRPFYCDT